MAVQLAVHNGYDEKIDVSEKYLIQPFKDCINDDNFFKTTNIMKYISAPTGFGKTFSLMKRDGWIYSLFEQGVKVVLVSIPEVGIVSEMDKRMCAGTTGAVLAETLEEVGKYLDKGADRILMIRHISMYKKNMLSDVLNKTTDVAMFVDECHYGMCSHIDNYRDVHGNSTTDYNAVLNKFCEELSKYTPYMFGITATPTTEMDSEYEGGKVPVRSELEYTCINPWPTKDDMLGRVAYLDAPDLFDLDDPEQATNALRRSCARVVCHNISYGTKIAGIIFIGADNVSTGYNQRWTFRQVYDYLLDMDLFDENGENRDFCISTSDTKAQVVFRKNPRRRQSPWFLSYKKEDELLEMLRDHNCSTKFLIVKEKGKMGIDVPTIKNILVLKATDKVRSSDYGSVGIVETIIQRIGRAFRLNMIGDHLASLKSNNYSLYGVVDNMNDSEFEEFIESNTIKVVAPSNNTMVLHGLRALLNKPYCIAHAYAKNKWMVIRNKINKG